MPKKKSQTRDKHSAEDIDIFLAVKSGDLKKVKKFFEEQEKALGEKFNINHQDKNGKTLAYYAIEEGHLNILKRLADNGASLSIIDSELNYASHIASKNGGLDILRYLDQKNQLNLLKTNEKNLKPIDLSLSCDKKELVEFLIEKHIKDDPEFLDKRDCKNTKYKTILLDLIFEKDWSSTLKMLNDLTKLNLIEGRFGCYQSTLAHYAAEKNSIEILKFLFEKGANLDLKDSEDSRPIDVALEFIMEESLKYLLKRNENNNIDDYLLHSAIELYSQKDSEERSKRRIIHLLLDSKKIEARDSEGNTPVMKALQLGRFDIFNILVENRANLRKVNNLEAGIPHFLALLVNNDEVIEFIKSNNINLNIVDHKGFGPWHTAAAMNNLKFLQLLKDKNIDIDRGSAEGITPLLLAVKGRSIEAINFLIANGADVNKFTSLGNNIAHLAAKISDVEIFKIALDNNVSIESVNADGKSALQVAIESESKEMLDLIKERGLATEEDIAKSSAPSTRPRTERVDGISYIPVNLASGKIGYLI